MANYVHFSLQGNVQCKRRAIRFYCEPSTYAPIGDVLYRNEGRRFVDVTKRMGIRAVGRGLGVAFADSDLDGDTDVYVANDGTPNFLYENQGTRFVEIGLRAGVQYNEDGHSEAGMGVDFGDFDNDGYADIFVTNYSRETNTLYWNDGRGRFADFTAHFGLGAPSYLPLGFGTKFMDYDNDGDLDLYVGNGHVVDNIEQLDADLRYAQPDLMLRNQGGAHFEEVSDQLGADFVVESVVRGAAAADWDNDGDLDLLATTVAGRPRLLRNGRGQSPALDRTSLGRHRSAGCAGCPRHRYRWWATSGGGSARPGELSIRPRSPPSLWPRSGDKGGYRDSLARRPSADVGRC